MLIVYVIVGLSGVNFEVPARHEWWLSPIVGVITGLVTGGTGVFTIPAVPIQALGLSFTVSTIALGAGLLRIDAFALAHAGAPLLAVVSRCVGRKHANCRQAVGCSFADGQERGLARGDLIEATIPLLELTQGHAHPRQWTRPAFCAVAPDRHRGAAASITDDVRLCR
jgi:hypothetical protein